MFDINPNPTFDAVVTLSRPGSAPGAVRFTFRHLGTKAFRALMDEVAAGSVSDFDAVSRLIKSWDETDPELGVNAPFSLEALEKMLDDFPAAGLEIVTQYRQAQAEHTRKN